MNTYTYRQAFDKITEAYIKGEIKPYECEFCFCGTLSVGNEWVYQSGFTPNAREPYTREEYTKMERALLSPLNGYGLLCGHTTTYSKIEITEKHDTYEDLLFAGMSAALDVLRQIHIERGEIINEVPEFVKRELA